MSLLLLILILILLFGALGSYPGWPHARNWGYGPFGGALGVLIVVLIVLALVGRL